MFVLIAIFLSTVLLYCVLNRSHKWKRLKIPGPDPIPIFGNTGKVAFLQTSLSEVYHDTYRRFPNCKYVGMYVMNEPTILARDPEIIENVLVKNFASFRDNLVDVKVEHDSIFGNNPFTAKGDAWKNKRMQHLSAVTPARVKAMFPETDECGNRMVSYLNKKLANGAVFCMESLELSARYLTETCTAVALGINSNSFTDGKSELREAGKPIFEPNFLDSVKIHLVFLIPQLSKFLPSRLIPDSLYRKYKDLVEETLKYRTENGIERNDFFDHLREFRGEKMSIEEMTAQLGALYIDGFGTNSTALSFMIYAVAAHPQIQDRLRDEIRDALGNCGVLTFDLIQEMTYLDAVISETFRKYPTFPNIFKVCTRECVLPRSTEGSPELNVEIGTTIVVPIYSLQNDEKYFPNPDKFDPGRFLGGNQVTRYAYLPFGEGPRICIGMKFAQLQSKLALIKLVQNFRLSVNTEKTKLPIYRHPPQSFILAAGDGIWINFEKL